jgi:hypothetical protein
LKETKRRQKFAEKTKKSAKEEKFCEEGREEDKKMSIRKNCKEKTL